MESRWKEGWVKVKQARKVWLTALCCGLAALLGLAGSDRAAAQAEVRLHLERTAALTEERQVLAERLSELERRLGQLETAGAESLTVSQIARRGSGWVVGVRAGYGYSIRTEPEAAAIERVSVSEGSGVVVRAEGYVLTNYHVVEPALREDGFLQICLADGREGAAVYVGGDRITDLALLRTELTGLEPAQLGESALLQVGERVVAIGSPLGLEFMGSVTCGVVSALDRRVGAAAEASLGLIQTDAAINPGNSGGALLNDRGEVVGINTVKVSAEGVEGMGFSIPIDLCKPLIEQMMTSGTLPGRPDAGILSGEPVTAGMSTFYGLPEGVLLTGLDPEGPAAQAGLREGDVCLSWNGAPVSSPEELEQMVARGTPGQRVAVEYHRAGSRERVWLELEVLPG